MSTNTCTRCAVNPCNCVYQPIYGQYHPTHSNYSPWRLQREDVERIAQRVVELMRAERGGAE